MKLRISLAALFSPIAVAAVGQDIIIQRLERQVTDLQGRVQKLEGATKLRLLPLTENSR